MLWIFFIFVASLANVVAEEWDAPSYPNPTVNGYRQCNMRSPSSLCDPDNVLSESERYRLNYELNQLESRTRQPQGDNFCTKKGIVAAIAIAKRVRGGSENAVKVMANDMLRKWTLDKQCSKSLVIVVSTEDRKFWVARDTRVPVYATEFTDLFNAQKPLFKDGKYQQALLNIIDLTREKALSKQAPAPDDGTSRGTPFQPTDPHRPDRGKSGGGFNPLSLLSKIPLWVILAIFLILIPTLCCCCCLYMCCCRKKNDGTENNNKRQSPADENPDAGRRSGGGGGLQGVLSGFGGAAAMNAIMNCIRSRGSSGGGGGGGTPAGGNAYQPAPTGPRTPQPQSKGLYPSVEVKDEGGGGNW